MKGCYVLAIFVAGLLFLCLTPPFQNPDEGVHLFRAIQLASGEMKGGVKDGILGCSVPRSVTLDYHQYSAMVKRVHVGTDLAEWKAIHAAALDWTPERWQDRVHAPCQFQQYPPVAHLPQASAALTGRLLHLNTVEVVYLGRFVCLVCGCAILFAAFHVLRDDPRLQLLAFLVAGLPTSIAMFSSLSADTLTIAFAILLFALAISLNKQWTARRFWAVAVCAALLALCKNVYFPLVIVALPAVWGHHPGWAARLKWAGLLFAVAIIPLALWFVYLGDLATVSVKPKMVLTPEIKLQEILDGPLQFLGGWISYLFNDRAYLESAFIGSFSWSEAGVPGYVAHGYVLMLLAGTVVGLAGTSRWNKWDASTRLITFIGIAFGIYLALFLMTGRVRITRTQARYYIPIALLLLSAIPIAWRLVPRWYNAWRAALLCGWGVAIVISCVVLYERFWAPDLASMRLGRMEQRATPSRSVYWSQDESGEWMLGTNAGTSTLIEPLTGNQLTLQYAVAPETWDVPIEGVRIDLLTPAGESFWKHVLRPRKQPKDRQLQTARVELPPDIGGRVGIRVRAVGLKPSGSSVAVHWKRVDFSGAPAVRPTGVNDENTDSEEEDEM